MKDKNNGKSDARISAMTCSSANEGLKKRNIVRDFLIDFNGKILERISKDELHGFFKTMQAMDEIIDEIVKHD